jgi:hypothetical protein
MHCRGRAAVPQRRMPLLVFAVALATLLRTSGAVGNATNASTPLPPPAVVTSCPAASSTNIICYVGVFPFRADVLAYTSGGGCTCNCSANATTLTSDYAGEPFLPPATKGLAVTYAAFPAICGPALCQSAFPSKCGGAANVNATFTPLGSWLTANASTTPGVTYAYPSPVVAAPGSVCVAYTARCTVLRSTNLCPMGVTTNNMTIYSAVSAAGCSTLLSQATRYAPYLSVVQACSSSGCNVPQAPPPPLPPPPPPSPPAPPTPVAASGSVWVAAPHKQGAIAVLLAAAALL